MGRKCIDFDIAINDQSGVQFATAVNDYMLSIGMEAKTIAVIQVRIVSSISILFLFNCCLQANPEQSKHLETATVKILGIDVDFVNLRAEEYTGFRFSTECLAVFNDEFVSQLKDS